MPGRELRKLQEEMKTLKEESIEFNGSCVSKAREARRHVAGCGAAIALLLLLLLGPPATAQVFGPPEALNTNADSDSGGDIRPRVTTDGAGRWVVVWSSNDSLGSTIGGDEDILVARSTDNGANWTAPAALNTNAGSDGGQQDYGPEVTTDVAGSWVAVWHSSGTTTDKDILVARSADNGASWTAPAALNTNAASDSGDDDVPQVTTDGAGSWVAVWESDDALSSTIGTDSDILVARSTDNGANWTAPAALNTNAGGDSGNDFDRSEERRVGKECRSRWSPYH